LKRFPDFPKATQYRVIIQPGESMFVPSRWWHAARVVSTSVSVCTNIMHSANWDGFIEISCESAKGKLSPSTLAKRLYLRVAGMIMSAVESLQENHPNSLLARRFGYLAPASPGSRR
jgi:hypothetical protein